MQSLHTNTYDEAVNTFIKQEQAKKIITLHTSTLAMQTVFVFACVFVFYGSISTTLLLWWAGLQCSIFVARHAFTYWWFRVKQHSTLSLGYEITSLGMCFFNSLLWGASAFIIDFLAYPEASVFLIAVNLGIGVGSTGMGGYWFRYFAVYSPTFMSIFAISFMVGVPNTNIPLGMMFLLFTLYLTRVVYVSYNNNIENLLLRRKNEFLAKSRGNFLAAASHDLRQPLQALNLFISALEGEENSQKSTTLLQQLKLSSHSLNELLNQILDVSKLDSNLLTVNKSPTALAPLFQRLAHNLAPQANEKGLTLTLSNTDLWVYTDAILLERLFSNLLDNAITYTEQGSVEVVITTEEADSVKVTIKDTGIGIEQEQQIHIFEEFYQVANSARDSAKGVGLGLSIVKRICERLSIPLQFSSAPSKGTQFHITLPIASAMPEAKNIQEQASFWDLSATCILIIDDNESVRRSIQIQLEAWHVSVLSADSLESALECVEGKPRPSLILSDYRLANDKNGIDAAEAVMTHIDGEDIPVLILSGDTDPKRLDEVKSRGYTLMHKPVKSAYLRAMIQRKLQNHAS